MKKSLFGSIIFFSFISNALAADLLSVYQEALSNDPVFKAARAAYMAERENVPISKALLLPSLSLSSSLGRSWTKYNSLAQDKDFYGNNFGYTLSLSQPIFNYSDWARVSAANAGVKSAEASFFSASQSLIFRTADAYFNVLQAEDVLRFTRAQKQAVWQQLEQTKQKYEVGLIAITGVDEAKAQYDKIVADEISQQNDLSSQIEILAEITKVKHEDLAKVIDNLPLIKPDPIDPEKWVSAALNQNYGLQSIKYQTVVAEENIRVQEGGHLPNITASGQFGYNYYDNYSGSNDFSRGKNGIWGLNLQMPLFSGGGVSAAIRQADYRYQQALDDQEKTYRAVMSQTRQSFLSVMSGISKIEADKQQIKSRQSALDSTRAGYEAGTRTMVDVLNAISNLYDAQRQYTIDQYSYLRETLNLKQLTGILSANDLWQINRWLRTPIVKTKGNDLFKPKNSYALKKRSSTITTVTTQKKSVASTSVFTQDHLLNMENRLLNADPNWHTILILENENKDKVTNFIKENNLGNNVFYYAVHVNGNYKYSLVKGIYKKLTVAEQEISKIKDLSGITPELKKLSYVQKKILHG
jgi:outer membrane protein